MSLTFNSKLFSKESSGPNFAQYSGPAHTLSAKQLLRLARTMPKPTSVFSGVGRSQAKYVQQLTLTGALTSSHDGIIDTSFSFPVGASSGDVAGMITDYAALMAHAAMDTLVFNLLTEY